MKIQFLFAWYDIWVGLFWDKRKRLLYILPIPMCGVVIKINPKCKCCKRTMKDDGEYYYCIHCSNPIEIPMNK